LKNEVQKRFSAASEGRASFEIPPTLLYICHNVTDSKPPLSTGVAIEDQLPIRFLLAADTIFARIYHSLTVISPSALPPKGPAILVCNHSSSIDPAFIQSVCRKRLITWMMAKEYLEIKPMAWLFNIVGVIPVERTGHDTGPLRAALRALKAGRVLGIFPEGKISETGGLLPFQVGAALMALKTGVPVYPAFLDGTQRNQGMLQAAFFRNKAKITFGPPLHFRGETSRQELDTTTASIRCAMELLRQQTDRYVPPL
jgi:1-acyl-sn-glycerol-3-phosphate acyltransferase